MLTAILGCFDLRVMVLKHYFYDRINDRKTITLKQDKGKEAKLCFMGYALMENRSGLVVDSRLTSVTGTAERRAALEMIEDVPGTKQITLGADRGYDVASFVKELRRLKATKTASSLR